MPTITREVAVEIEVDLEDIDDDDLIEEIIYRIMREDFSKNELLKLKNALQGNFSKISKKGNVSLEDICKQEHFQRIFDQYTLSEIEFSLPVK